MSSAGERLIARCTEVIEILRADGVTVDDHNVVDLLAHNIDHMPTVVLATVAQHLGYRVS